MNTFNKHSKAKWDSNEEHLVTNYGITRKTTISKVSTEVCEDMSISQKNKWILFKQRQVQLRTVEEYEAMTNLLKSGSLPYGVVFDRIL